MTHLKGVVRYKEYAVAGSGLFLFCPAMPRGAAADLMGAPAAMTLQPCSAVLLVNNNNNNNNNNNKHLRCGNRKGLLGRNGYLE